MDNNIKEAVGKINAMFNAIARNKEGKLTPVMFGKESDSGKGLVMSGAYFEEFLDTYVFFKTEEGRVVSKDEAKTAKMRDCISGTAFVNAMEQMKIFPLADALTKASGITVEEAQMLPIYVLSTEEGVFGASLIANCKVREMVYKCFGECYILPSSVHEVLIVPEKAYPGNSREQVEHDLLLMVETINITELSPQEVLTDSIYRLGKDGEMSVITEAA